VAFKSQFANKLEEVVLTNAKINVAIAKAMGLAKWQIVANCPNYCEDLNAVNEAEELVWHKWKATYLAALEEACGVKVSDRVWLLRATARQRAVAICDVLDLLDNCGNCKHSYGELCIRRERPIDPNNYCALWEK